MSENAEFVGREHGNLPQPDKVELPKPAGLQPVMARQQRVAEIESRLRNVVDAWRHQHKVTGASDVRAAMSRVLREYE